MPAALPDFTYNLFESQITETWADGVFSSSEPTSICGDWSYSLEMADDGSVIDARAFSSDLASGTYNLKTYSTDEAMIGMHNIKLKGW